MEQNNIGNQDIEAIIRYNAAYLDIDEVAYTYACSLPDINCEDFLIAMLDFKLEIARIPRREGRAVMLYLAGYTQLEIGSMYQVSHSTVGRWIGKFFGMLRTG
jgi:DNA-directed RNA polymerase specialized sigma24 family protein